MTEPLQAIHVLIEFVLLALLAATLVHSHRRSSAQKENLAEMRTEIAELDAMLEGLPLAVSFKDAQGRYLRCNAAFEKITGLAEDVIRGKTVMDVMPDDLAPEYRDSDTRLFERGGTYRFEAPVLFAGEARPRQVMLNKALCYSHEGGVAGIVCAMTDISNRRELERQLERFASHLQTVVERAPLAIITCDRDDRIAGWNGAAVALFGWTAAEVTGRKFSAVLPVDAASRHSGIDTVKAVASEATKNVMLKKKRAVKSGASVDVLETWVQLDDDGEEGGSMVFMLDVGRQIAVESALKDIEERIYRLAHFDALTGLANRSLLRERLHAAIEAAERGFDGGAVLIVDLDGFRTVNDGRGVDSGDTVLKRTAAILRRSSSAAATIGRLGSDEFMIILEGGASRDDAARFAEEILAALKDTSRDADPDAAIVGATIGIAMLLDDGADVATLMRRADAAVKAAKAARRGSYHFFSTELEARSHQAALIERLLPQAIRANELHMMFQPIYGLKDMRVDLVEALVRWTLPDGRVIPPNDFVPVAERLGLIDELGRWTMAAAARHAVRWRQRGFAMRVAVNLSPSNIGSAEFRRDVEHIIAATGVDPAQIEIEMTEGVFAADRTVIQEALKYFRSLGMTVAIDDFGTGYSGLAYLRNFAVDTLKIDRSFVASLGGGEDELILRTVIAIAKQLGLDTVAEGVETREQLLALKGMGCTRVQGFHLARPMDADHVEDLLRVQSLEFDALVAATA